MTHRSSLVHERAGRADLSKICVDDLTRLAISCNYHSMEDDQQEQEKHQQQQQQGQHQISPPDGLPPVTASPCSPSLTTAAGPCATQSVSEAPMTDFTAPEPSFFPPTLELQHQTQGGGQDQLRGLGVASSLPQQTTVITTSAAGIPLPTPASRPPTTSHAVAPLNLAALTSQTQAGLQQQHRQQLQQQQFARLSSASASPVQLSPSQTSWPASSVYGDDFSSNYSLHNSPVTGYVSHSVPSSQATSPRWASQARFDIMWKQQQHQASGFQQSQAHMQQQQQRNDDMSSNYLGGFGMVGDSAFGSQYGDSLSNQTSFEQNSIYPPPVTSSMQHPSYSAGYPSRFDGCNISSLVNGMSQEDARSVKGEGGMGNDITSPLSSDFDDVYPTPMDHSVDSSTAVSPIGGSGSNALLLRPRPGSGIGAGSSAASKEGGEPYAQLIYRALMSRKNYTMSLQEIYQWFRENTDKGKGEHKGWQNSIRHNLSMNAAFSKKSNVPASPSSTKGGTSEPQKKTNEWFLEDWAVEKGVQSTTRYRKNQGGSSKRPRPAPSGVIPRVHPRHNGHYDINSAPNPPGQRGRGPSSVARPRNKSHLGISQAHFGLPYAQAPYHSQLQMNPHFGAFGRSSYAADFYPSPPPTQHPHHALPLPMPLSSSSTAPSSVTTGQRHLSEPLTPPDMGPSASQQQRQGPPHIALDSTSATGFDVDGVASDTDGSGAIFAGAAADVPGLEGLMCGGGMAWEHDGVGEYGYRGRGVDG